MRQRPFLAEAAALLRPRIGLLAAAGAAAGALACGLPPGLELGLAAGGAFLLSGAVSAINQVQERREDARMERTKDRPLAAGRMDAKTALGLGLCALALAAAALARTPGGWTAALFAPLTLIVYNGLYTPLKKQTSLAMLVGGLAGAFPPLVGAAAAGADPLGARALLLAGVFYAWQVPHFWLFARMHRADYEAAGFRVPQDSMPREPMPEEPMPEGGLPRHAAAPALWLAAYGALMLLVPAFGVVALPLWQGLTAALAVGLALGAWPLLSRSRLGFAVVNASLVLLLCFIAADALGISGPAA